MLQIIPVSALYAVYLGVKSLFDKPSETNNHETKVLTMQLQQLVLNDLEMYCQLNDIDLKHVQYISDKLTIISQNNTEQSLNFAFKYSVSVSNNKITMTNNQ
jgi:hypothetical protein